MRCCSLGKSVADHHAYRGNSGPLSKPVSKSRFLPQMRLSAPQLRGAVSIKVKSTMASLLGVDRGTGKHLFWLYFGYAAGPQSGSWKVLDVLPRQAWLPRGLGVENCLSRHKVELGNTQDKMGSP